MNAILQVALDFTDLNRALILADEVSPYVDWIEAGTPLIKAEGMTAIRELKKRFPKKTIVADLKIADTGDIETEMAAKSGADIVTVLASMDDATISQAVKSAKKYDCKVLVDLLNVSDPVTRAIEVEALGADIIMIHTGIDQQMRDSNLFERLKKVSSSVGVPVAAGGGIKPENVAEALKNGADILIVGGAITKAKDARSAAKQFKEAIVSGKSAKKAKKLNVSETFKKVSTSNISDAMHRSGEMKGLSAVNYVDKVIGKAYTVRAYPGDWSKTVRAVDEAENGDVIVIDAHKSDIALWGGLASLSAKKKGIAGVIMDGAVRDIEEIRASGLTVFARSVTPTAGEPKGLGELNVSIKCAGAEVSPGDFIIADENGVVVVPKREVMEVANRALYVKEREERVREEIKGGSSLGKVLELGKWEKIGL
jgi:3-hexulose-6-phosphate synthase / 6-phospho-3-hexuloisomerase